MTFPLGGTSDCQKSGDSAISMGAASDGGYCGADGSTNRGFETSGMRLEE